MTDTSQPVDSALVLSELQRKTKRLSVWSRVLMVLFVLLLGAVSSVAFFFWRKAKAIEQAQKDLSFSQLVTDYNDRTDFVTPAVNTTQFLRRGFSIEFETVRYTQDGLLLIGTIGNATELSVSSLAVNFAARPYPYKFREKWENAKNGPWLLYSDELNIGSGQRTVGVLNPGSSAPFSVTIPDVKQTSDSIEIAVSFTGERYSYPR